MLKQNEKTVLKLEKCDHSQISNIIGNIVFEKEIFPRF